LLLQTVPAGPAAADALLIQRFAIEGNRILDDAQLQAVVEPFTGPARGIDDIRAALLAIEKAYRAAGYGAVRAVTPEQEITTGVIRIRVIEAELGEVQVVGNTHFSDRNVLAGLPSLRTGTAPDLRRLAENLQLANENPARKSEVLLSATEQEGVLEARVLVEDSRPLTLSASLDNTGNSSTGRHRLGVAVQHANLFDRDHVATAAYTTSPEEPDQVDIYSVSYRLPLYSLGDSLDFIFGDSSVASGTSETVAGPLDFSGDGRVIVGRYNHYFPRRGEYASRLTFGWEQRRYENECVIAGVTCGSADADIEVRPASLTYSGRWDSPGRVSDFYLSAARNIPGGSRGSSDDFAAIRAGADADYALLRAGGSHLRALGTWQFRSALHLQYASGPLIPAEQFSLAGSTATRGFEERALATDSGVVVNLELYTPGFAVPAGLPGTLRGVLFVDGAAGRNHDVVSSVQVSEITVASAGAGLRGELGRRAALLLDVASVIVEDTASSERRGDVKAHFAINLQF
jgi:hemolysin activation/secretion protein